MTPHEEDTERMQRAVERYRARFLAVHGEEGQRRGTTPADDHALFGDFVDVGTMNSYNVQAVEAYMNTMAGELARVIDEADDDEVDIGMILKAAFPVMLGMFEHCWLVGYLYRDEQEKDRKGKLIIP